MIHAVYDLTDCDTAEAGPIEILEAMRATAARLGCTVLGELPVTFQPHGTTCVLVLAESHLTVSTWPEHRLVHVDLFTCHAETDPDDAMNPIITTVRPRKVQASRVHRHGPLTTGQPTRA